MKLRRWTPLMFAFPQFYVEESEFWADRSLGRWSDREYEWTRDAWNGVRDFAQPPRTTYEECRGDCEDYALVAACVLVSRGRTNLHFAVVTSRVIPEHFVLYDTERERVYSSGIVHEKTLDEYVADSRYERSISRPIA
jgi:hypothetical protein